MMAKGISLHIGLNHIDRAHYGIDGTLGGCENDASAMRRVASSLGYASTILLTAAAVSEDILSEIRRAALQLEVGDRFLLTYAGHGAQVPDVSGDEADQKDETWCVYDRMILDDELAALWKEFKPGVLIVLVSDSCHSGTVYRRLMPGAPAVVARALPWPVAAAVYERNQSLYGAMRRMTPKLRGSQIDAGLIELAACQDDQSAADGEVNGLFTEKLLQAWEQGRFAGGYLDLIDAIRSLMPEPDSQTPGCTTLGATSSFISERPFVIPGGASEPAKGENWEQVAGVLSRHLQAIVTPRQPRKHNMQQQIVDNGNWEEVAAALSQQIPSKRGGGGFMADVIAANAKMAEDVYSASAAGHKPEAGTERGGGEFRAFWWGFNVQIGHGDLDSLLRATDPDGDIMRFLNSVITDSRYKSWVTILTPFISGANTLLRALDRGRGIYVSMSWFAPGVFVPTSA